ncbi:MAG: hypothetical protein GC165_00175 [Armatimonadetes bacterium]|nr:hypothetical protein [Armatimonadota bacterium]
MTELLMFPLDDLEKQIDWLPLRKAKRPGAYLIEAVRRKYQPPKEFFYAKDQIEAARIADTLDTDPKPRYR